MMTQTEKVVIRFCGDSGDGMQLVGTQLSNTSAVMGNDISTFPDFPAEIRAPAGTIPGVSGFQVHIGATEVHTPGDAADVIVAMNPAALKANLRHLKKGGTIIVNIDSFDERNLAKAGYERSPLGTHALEDYKVVEAPITTQTVSALQETELDNKSKGRCKNFYALGMTYYMFSRSFESTQKWLEQKFAKKPHLAAANVTALKAGYHYAETIEAIAGNVVSIDPARIAPGKYRHINGNTALAWGLMQAAEASGRELFLGSYPITPASDILHELSKHKHHKVCTFQAEDEIAAVCSAIGASFGGALAVTTSSGPGICLKGEALGLITIYELPLVVVDIQRGGPSTGLPTKTEQSDLNLALYGRNGESPMIIIAAQSPSDCFKAAYEAAKLSLEHMTPVMLLSDGYIANGAEPWLIPSLEDYQSIQTQLIDENFEKGEQYLPYKRNEMGVRPWAIPGVAGFEHRLGGLEKEDETGNVSYDPDNHEKMTLLRQQKVDNVAQVIPEQELEGETTGDLLVVSWGGTYGATSTAVKELREQGHSISLMHLRYINPMPKNVEEIFKSFKKILVCELNKGQLQKLINSRFSLHAAGYQKVQGQPFKVSELLENFKRHLG